MNIEKYCFIVGNARSSTTIITQIVNSSSSVVLLEEANFYRSSFNHNFVDDFNLQHQSTGKFPAKGRFLPTAWRGKSPLEIMEIYENHYALIGEKIAFGPFGSINGVGQQDLFLDFHYSKFHTSKYLFTAREPLSSLMSLRRLFPLYSASNLLAGWIESLMCVVMAVRLFPFYKVIISDQLNKKTLSNIYSFLNIQGDIPSNWIYSAKRKRTLDFDLCMKDYCEADNENKNTDRFEYALRSAIEAFQNFHSAVDERTLHINTDVIPFMLDETVLKKCKIALEHLESNSVQYSPDIGYLVNTCNGYKVISGNALPTERELSESDRVLLYGSKEHKVFDGETEEILKAGSAISHSNLFSNCGQFLQDNANQSTYLIIDINIDSLRLYTLDLLLDLNSNGNFNIILSTKEQGLAIKFENKKLSWSELKVSEEVFLHSIILEESENGLSNLKINMAWNQSADRSTQFAISTVDGSPQCLGHLKNLCISSDYTWRDNRAFYKLVKNDL